jgi:hypothetical protein
VADKIDSRMATMVKLSKQAEAWWVRQAKAGKVSKTYAIEIAVHKLAGCVAQEPGQRGRTSRLANFLSRPGTPEEKTRETAIVADLGKRACYDGTENYSAAFASEWDRVTKALEASKAKTSKAKILPKPAATETAA